jgi:hypothetical protein
LSSIDDIFKIVIHIAAMKIAIFERRTGLEYILGEPSRNKDGEQLLKQAPSKLLVY